MVTRKFYIAIFISLIQFVAVAHAQAGQSKHSCNTVDFDHTNSPQCVLPHLNVSQAKQGYLSANGTWTPDGFIDKADIEFTCIQAYVPQVSESRSGFCLMASAILLSGIPAVSTNYFEVKSWERTKLIAERSESWQSMECGSQVLVFDFRFNTITLTSTLNRSQERCNKRLEAMEKFTQKPFKANEVFTLVHSYGSPYVEGDNIKAFNPYFQP